MTFGKKVAILGAAGILALACMVTGAAPASAHGCWGPVCGEVINQTDRKVHVCTMFTKGEDFQYHPNYCKEGHEGAVMPHTKWGGHGVDIDAIRIESGIRYNASIACFSPGRGYTLDHIDGLEWWKFPTDCTITIKSVGPAAGGGGGSW